MKLIELHILQSFPVSCLNRDDVGAPKTAVFGGCTRARISSQCLKRAIREMAHEKAPTLFGGIRSRLFVAKVAEAIAKKDKRGDAEALARCAGHYLGKLDPKDNAKVKTLMFLSPAEYDRLADVLLSLAEDKRQELLDAVARVNPVDLDRDEEESGDDQDKEEAPTTRTKRQDSPMTAKQFTKKVSSLLKAPIKRAFGGSGFVKDAADIAIFGRMVASDPSLTVEGAGMFSHALSTHKADTDMDFFAAVDDLQGADEAGAGMTGTLEFNSACYYRYAALNLELLFDDDHLASLEQEERKQVVEAFLRSTLLAVPGARKNSMNANTLPSYVLGVVKDQGQPIQLVNAFEKPTKPTKANDGLVAASINLLREHHEDLKKTWSIETATEVAIPDKPLAAFCKEILEHV
jgi:CRISPR system Cascade subunit CasC